MSRKDYTKQAERRQRIKRRTLVVGVDIGCNFNALGFMNKAGEVLGRYPKVYNSRQGFEYFVRVIEGSLDLDGIIIIYGAPAEVKLPFLN